MPAHLVDRMRLAEFILAHTEAILAEWEQFARAIWPSSGTVAPDELLDHAGDILRAVARDMQSAQTSAERSSKSRGESVLTATGDRLDDASDDHAADRVMSGFKLGEVLAEYRALRASVLRLWQESVPDPSPEDLDDVTRFNEAVDQSITRALTGYTRAVDRSRQMFLAVLGHDLRGPLAAVDLWAKLIARKIAACRTGPDSAATLNPADLDQIGDGATSIISSAAAMTEMIHSLTDFASAALGGAVPVSPARTDLGPLCRDVLNETKIAFPNCRVQFEPSGDLVGEWDAPRLRQVLSNLLINAAEHGHKECDVGLSVRGDDPHTVVIAVHNAGRPIAPGKLGTIFDPFVRLSDPLDRPRRPGSLGLGLFIARQTITAHGGDIHAVSSPETGTTFIAHLPRHPP